MRVFHPRALFSQKKSFTAIILIRGAARLAAIFHPASPPSVVAWQTSK